jgi:hypothetical protein
LDVGAIAILITAVAVAVTAADAADGFELDCTVPESCERCSTGTAVSTGARRERRPRGNSCSRGGGSRSRSGFSCGCSRLTLNLVNRPVSEKNRLTGCSLTSGSGVRVSDPLDQP